MADKLPKLMVLKAGDGYACYTDKPEAERGYVQCGEKSVFSTWAKIEVEQPKKADANKYVHLRFSHSNKYWARSGDHNGQIAAVSNLPEEDTSKISCTLFEPTIGDDGLLYLTHVQSRKRVRTDEKTTRVYVDDEEVDGLGGYGFAYVDVDTLVQIPKNLTFKGDNGKYLKAVWYGTPWDWSTGLPSLQLSASDGYEMYVAYEAHPLPDGHVRIKSVTFGRFWKRDTSDWIYGYDDDDDSSSTKESHFWPVKVDSQTIALRSAANGLFCQRSGDSECLRTSASKITKEAKLVVEELVLERNVYNIRYRLEDARVYDSQPFVAGVGTATNDSDTEATFTITVAYQASRSYTFTSSRSLNVGIKTTFETGIPYIAEGKVEVSASVTFGQQWQTTTQETKSAQATYTVKVPPRTHVTVSYVGECGKCDVPFSYTQKDKSSSDGQLNTTQHIDGIFNGVDNYNFRFEDPKMLAM